MTTTSVLLTVLPSACVSPSDRTLTVEKVMEVMGEVGMWVGVGIFLGVPLHKRNEIQQQSSTETEKSRAVGEYWVQYVPHASWEGLSTALYRWGKERAAVMAKQYLPKGMCISLPPQRVYGVCILMDAHQYSLVAFSI